MPEGGTIRLLARALDAALAGKVVTGFRSALPALRAAAERLGTAGPR